MKVKKSVVFAAALACGILLAVPLGAAAASSYRMAENGPATREESARLNRTFLYLNIEYNDRAPHEQLSLDTAGDSVVSWRSADPSIVTVSPDGVVTACAEGITNVYADTASGTTLSCAVTVTNNIGRVSLSESRLYLEDMGSKAALTVSDEKTRQCVENRKKASAQDAQGPFLCLELIRDAGALPLTEPDSGSRPWR